MIQRIQSIFLFLAGTASFGQFGLPYGNGYSETVPALTDGRFNIFDNIGLIGLVVGGGLISLIAIFLYKNRLLQTKVAQAGALVSLVLLGFAAYLFKQNHEASAGVMQAGLGLGLPLISAIFQWLAARSIKKDENLVRSMDRLR